LKHPGALPAGLNREDRKMAMQRERTRVNLNESSVYADDKSPLDPNQSDDLATDADLDRLETITGGADEPLIAEGDLGQKFDELDVSTEEELDALKVNLLQEDERPNARDGSGLIVDDAAEERIARFTESDPRESDMGAISVEPGREEASSVLRRHHPNTTIARSDAVVEGNLDEPMDETKTEPRADEGTAG
jgi:hypothetical protein